MNVLYLKKSSLKIPPRSLRSISLTHSVQAGPISALILKAEPEANNSHGAWENHAASRGFLATARLLFNSVMHSACSSLSLCRHMV